MKWRNEMGGCCKPQALRDAVKDIFTKFEDTKGVNLPRGTHFVKAAEFELCCSLGKFIGVGERFKFNLTEIKKKVSQAGVLGAKGAKVVWQAMIDEDDNYFQPLLVSHQAFLEGHLPIGRAPRLLHRIYACAWHQRGSPSTNRN